MKSPYPKDRVNRLLTKPAQLLILHLVLEKPGNYLHEIQKELIDVLLLCVSLSTICTFLQKGFKLHATAIQQYQFLREKYTCDVTLFVYVDQTGADRRKYGYSLCGKPIRNHQLLMRGE